MIEQERKNGAGESAASVACLTKTDKVDTMDINAASCALQAFPLARDPKAQRDFEKLYGLGVRVCWEAFLELARFFEVDENEIRRMFARYAGLPADIVAAVGADKMPPKIFPLEVPK